MIRAHCIAAALCVALTGCHFLLAAPVVAVTTGLGAASSAASLAKDVLEIDVTARNLFAAPAPSPAAVP